jgi:lincosamide nucleotidyltransferase A/C/D/E
MDASTEGQLRLIHKVVAVTRAAGIPLWLFGGWGLDARIGRITRDHGDVEFWIERHQEQQSKTLLAGAGAIPLLTRPPEESCEFTWDGVPFSTAYLIASRTERSPSGAGGRTGNSRPSPLVTIRAFLTAGPCRR